MSASRNPPKPKQGPKSGGIAFLLAQVGAHAAERFAERVAEVNLTPAQAGLIRAVSRNPGRSQQVMAAQLRIQPSRFVALVDDLEARGLIERRRNESDRRLYALHLTADGEHAMTELGTVGQDHENDLCAALSAAERSTLRDLLLRIAEEQDLTPGVHPGYRRLPGRRR